jgi:ABC-type multidrug transport system fused ATPase/permease subunit
MVKITQRVQVQDMRDGQRGREVRLAALEREVERVQRRLDRLSARSLSLRSAQLGIFIGGVVVSIFVLFAVRWLGVLAFVLTAVAFVWAMRETRKVDRSVVRHRVWLQLKQAQEARMRLDWDALPAARRRDAEEYKDHPFEVDLDITGEHSLHRLLNVAVSFEGRERLLNWLLNTIPDEAEIRRRQELVRDLTPMSLFRDKLQLHGLYATRYDAGQVDAGQLLEWLEKPTSPQLSASSLVAPTLLSGATLLLIAFYLSGLLSPLYFLLFMLVSLAYYLLTRKGRGNLVADAAALRDAFGQLEPIFSYLERYPYGKHERVRALCAPFSEDRSRRPSVLLKRLSRLASAAALEQSDILGLVVNALLPWDAWVAYQLNRCRAQVADVLPAWLEVWYELEALCSLANFAYLNPDFTMPELVTETDAEKGTPVFEAVGLGHPLIAAERRVVNDFRAETPGQIVMITGSNMAGKSTFLRTLGINLCLAYAGGPVNAARLRTRLFEVYACIKVSDSLADGYSYFYAEVRRLRGLLAKLEEERALPVFFLIDEIYRGTNNYERLIGSRAYIRALAGKHCVGALSTHDLELVKLSETLPEIRHYHFREEVVKGRLVFDYRLRPGPCPTRNALKIMQLEGLPVE